MPGAPDRFELVAGERRWRALQRAGMREALVVVKDLSAKDAFEVALIENVQREDLNPIELAEAFERLVREHGYTQEALAERLGKDRTTIANGLRASCKLPPRVVAHHRGRADSARGTGGLSLGAGRRRGHRRSLSERVLLRRS